MSSFHNEDSDHDNDDSNNNHDIPDDKPLKHFTKQDSYLGLTAEVEDDATNAFSKGVITEGKKVLTKLYKSTNCCLTQYLSTSKSW